MIVSETFVQKKIFDDGKAKIDFMLLRKKIVWLELFDNEFWSLNKKIWKWKVLLKKKENG